MATSAKKIEANRKNARKPGTGRPKGSLAPATIERASMKKLIEQRVFAAHESLINAQLRIAVGQMFLYKIEKRWVPARKGEGGHYENKEPKLVTVQQEIFDYLANLAEHDGDLSDDKDPSATYYFITTKEPNNEALKDLFNRVHGKPKETVDISGEVKFSLVALAEKRNQLPNVDITKIHNALPNTEASG